MKVLVAVLLVLLLSCSKEKEKSVQAAFEPAYLIGNWTTIPNDPKYLRWTLDKKNWSETWVKKTSCEPVDSRTTFPYTIVNDTLAIDWGISKQIQDNFYLIKSLTPTRMVLYRTYFKEEVIFEKCQ